LTDPILQASRVDDETILIFEESLVVDAWTIVETFEERNATQLEEVLETL
jgi:hypothetical protein